jgi:hypothetical protein
MQDPTPRLIKIGDALSQLANVSWPFWDHTETNANESISGRSYRMGWTRMVRFVDFLLGEGHCKRAFLNDIERAHRTLTLYPWEDLPRDKDL